MAPQHRFISTLFKQADTVSRATREKSDTYNCKGHLKKYCNYLSAYLNLRKSAITTSVAEPHHFEAAPDPGRQNYAATTPSPWLIKC
jgi:hypothetical protein